MAEACLVHLRSRGNHEDGAPKCSGVIQNAYDPTSSQHGLYSLLRRADGKDLGITETANTVELTEMSQTAGQALEKKHGARFKPAKLLVQMAGKGDTFYRRFGAGKAKAAA